MGHICRLAARGPSLQGLGFSGRFERLGGTDDAIPVLSSAVLSFHSLPCHAHALPCPFSCRSAARVTTCPGFPRSSPTIHLLPTVRCLLVTQPSVTLGRIRAASTRHPCTDRPPQPRAAERVDETWTVVLCHGAVGHELLLEACCISRTRSLLCAHIYIRPTVTPTGGPPRC